MIERFALHSQRWEGLATLRLERASDTADTDAERLRLHLRRADMLARHGQHSQALEALDTAQAWLRLVPDAVLHAQAAVIAARIYARERNDLERALNAHPPPCCKLAGYALKLHKYGRLMP